MWRDELGEEFTQRREAAENAKEEKGPLINAENTD